MKDKVKSCVETINKIKKLNPKAAELLGNALRKAVETRSEKRIDFILAKAEENLEILQLENFKLEMYEAGKNRWKIQEELMSMK